MLSVYDTASDQQRGVMLHTWRFNPFRPLPRSGVNNVSFDPLLSVEVVYYYYMIDTNVFITVKIIWNLQMLIQNCLLRDENVPISDGR